MVGKKKESIITFKVDETLGEALDNIPNKSEFIRQAILRSLSNECPLCHGAGTLTPNQMNHWQNFLDHHSLTRCHDCNELYLRCDAAEDGRHH